LNKSKNVWNCRKLAGYLMIAKMYISTNMTAAMRKRIFEFDNLVFGLIAFTDAILFLLLPGSAGGLIGCIQRRPALGLACRSSPSPYLVHGFFDMHPDNR